MKVREATKIIVSLLLLIGLGFLVLEFSPESPGKITRGTSTDSGSESYPLVILEMMERDPYSAKPRGITTVLFDQDGFYRRTLGVEIGLNEEQLQLLNELVYEELGMELAAQHNEPVKLTFEEWYKIFDSRVRESFSPWQYVLFRDWVAEQWLISLYEEDIGRGFVMKKWAAENGKPYLEPKTLTYYLNQFLKNNLQLSEREIQRIDTLFEEADKQLIPLRIKAVEIATDNFITIEETKIRIEPVTRKIEQVSKKLYKNLARLISRDKLYLFNFYQQVPE